MFDFLKKKKTKQHTLGSPVKGKAVLLKDVSDPTFAQEMLGKGVAVIPSDGRIVAPCDGRVTMLFNTLHAVSVVPDYGAEILIHVGIDTVNMKGAGFTAHVKVDDTVRKGDLLLTVDLDQVKAAGYDTTTMMVVCNTPNYASVTADAPKDVEAGDDVLTITEN